MKTKRQPTTTHNLGNSRKILLMLACLSLAITAGVVFIWQFSASALAEKKADNEVVTNGVDPHVTRSVASGSNRVYDRLKDFDPQINEPLPDGPSELPRLRLGSDSPQAGAVDPTFVPNVTEGTASGLSLASQPDGKFLVGGFWQTVNGLNRRCLERFNADGTRDETFNPGGIGPNCSVYEILVLPDAKIMIAGFFSSYNSTSVQRLARLNSDGTLDPSFVVAGGVNGGFYDAVIQPDGKILVSGSFNQINGVTRNSVARLNADGTLDAAFDPNVMLQTSSGLVYEMALQPDGKIVIGGFINTVGGTARNGLARLNGDGTLDLSFDVGTGLQGPTGNNSARNATAVALQPDGKVLIGGNFDRYNGIERSRFARINPDGTLDTAFTPATTGLSLESLALQPDGKIVATGFLGELDPRSMFAVTRYNADGTPDSAFNIQTADGSGYVVRLQADGRILLAGFFNDYGVSERRMFARLNSNGTLDSAAAVFLRDPYIYAVEDAGNGKVYIGGLFRRVNGVGRRNIARLNSDGSLDATFDPLNGVDSYNSGQVRAIAVQGDGKVFVGGVFRSFNGQNKNHIVRLNSNGSIDTGFNFNDALHVYDIDFPINGGVALAGFFSNSTEGVSTGIVKLNSDGTYDETVVGTGANGTVIKILREADGRAFISGVFNQYNGTTRNYIARINIDGSLETNFDPGTGTDDYANTMALAPGGGYILEVCSQPTMANRPPISPGWA